MIEKAVIRHLSIQIGNRLEATKAEGRRRYIKLTLDEADMLVQALVLMIGEDEAQNEDDQEATS